MTCRDWNREWRESASGPAPAHLHRDQEEEILNKRDVLINLTILYPAADAVEVNDIEHALNYRTITKAIIRHVEENRFALLERMTQEILDLVMENPAVRYAEVEVDKPHALRFAESVSITLAGHR